MDLAATDGPDPSATPVVQLHGFRTAGADDAAALQRLARELTHARAAAGLTQQQVAAALPGTAADMLAMVRGYENGQLAYDAPLWFPYAYARAVGCQLRTAVMHLTARTRHTRSPHQRGRMKEHRPNPDNAAYAMCGRNVAGRPVLRRLAADLKQPVKPCGSSCGEAIGRARQEARRRAPLTRAQLEANDRRDRARDRSTLWRFASAGLPGSRRRP